MNIENGMQAFKPSIWHRLGFRYRGDESLFEWRTQETEGLAPSAICSRTVVNVDFLDRIRLLVSGRCELTVWTKTDVVVNTVVSRGQFAVLPPNTRTPRHG